MVIKSLELKRANPDRNIFSKFAELKPVFSSVRFGAS